MKKEAQDKADKEQSKARSKEERDRKKAEGGIMNLSEAYLGKKPRQLRVSLFMMDCAGDAIDWALDNQAAAGGTGLVLFLTLLYTLFGSSGKKKKSRPTQPVPKPEEKKEELEEKEGDDDDEEEEEKDN